MLRYEDLDGDMISFNTDDEFEEALRLCVDGKTLKMTLTAAQRSVKQEEPIVDACALSNVFKENSSAPSESGDFEMETYSLPSPVYAASAPVQPSEMLRDRPADEQDDALEAAVIASIEEEHSRVAREARDAAEFDALQAALMASSEHDALQARFKACIEEENARVAREAAEEEGEEARLEVAFAAAEEDALHRADELLSMGCSVDQIRLLYGESILSNLHLVLLLRGSAGLQ